MAQFLQLLPDISLRSVTLHYSINSKRETMQVKQGHDKGRRVLAT